MRHAFVTVTDADYFPGTLATLASVLAFAPKADVHVVVNDKRALSASQAARFADRPRVFLHAGTDVARGRHMNAWELKAYAIEAFAPGYDVIVAIDSDCVLAGPLDDVLDAVHASGGFAGGRDGERVEYDARFAVYDMQVPAVNTRYMSTSICFFAATPANQRLLARWSEACARAEFNGQGPFPGHGDQGVLNALLFAARRTDAILLLDNRLWSQHWTYWDDRIEARAGSLFNVAAQAPQRAVHTAFPVPKHWTQAHASAVRGEHSARVDPYVWYLALLWYGPCRALASDPHDDLPPSSHHLVEDLVHYLPQIFQAFAPARARHAEIGEALLARALHGVARMVQLGGAVMSELIALVASRPLARRFVEVGGFEGGMILTLALAFAHRDLHCYAVESFAGNADDSVDGQRLPRRDAFTANLARFASLRASLVPGRSPDAAALFDDASLDIVFIDADHANEALLADIDAWLPKLVRGGVLCGDDYDWRSVREAVDARLPGAACGASGKLWWITC